MNATTVYSLESYIQEMMMNDPAASQAAMEMMAMEAEMYDLLVKILLPVLGVGLLLGLITLIAMWKIYKKAGQAGWKVLIPVYSDYILFKISWKTQYFWIAMVLAILCGAVTGVSAYIPEYFSALTVLSWVLCLPALVIELRVPFKLARAFRKGFGFGLGLLLLPWIFLPILGFGKAKFRRRKRRKAIAPAPEAQ